MKTILFVLLLATAVEAAPRNEIIVVAMGGYKSCRDGSPTGMGMYSAVHDLMKEMKVSDADRKVHYVISCLNAAAPPKAMGRYLTSRLPDQTLSGNTDTIRQEIEAIAKRAPEAPVFMAGHSYGGWMAMRLASDLAPHVSVEGLYTIDPISPRCGPTQVIFGDADCRRAPVDLDNVAIKRRVLRWENFYQTQDTWLRSSKIDEAGNHHIVYNGPHTSIDSDSRTWTVIRGAIYEEIR